MCVVVSVSHFCPSPIYPLQYPSHLRLTEALESAWREKEMRFPADKVEVG